MTQSLNPMSGTMPFPTDFQHNIYQSLPTLAPIHATTMNAASLAMQQESFARPNTLQPTHVLQHSLSTSPPSQAHTPLNGTQVPTTATFGTMHARTISTSGDESDNEQPARKRSKKSSEDILESAGAQFGLMSDMYRDIRKAVQLRLHHQSADGMTSTVDKKLYALGCDILRILPDTRSRIVAGGETGPMTFSATLNRGRKHLHSALVNASKNAISQWFTFEPRLDSVSKDYRGFHHAQTGRLLCPVDLDWDNPRVRQGLRDCEFHKYPITPDHFPRFLWPDDANLEDDVEFSMTMFRSDWVLKAVTLFLYGSEAAVKMQSASVVFGASTGNSKARAHNWGVTSITPACIALGAVMIRHSLSDQKTFHMGDMKDFRVKAKAKVKSGAWPSKAFYHLLIEYMENIMSPQQRDDLLDWYSRKVLGSGLEDSDDDLDGQDDGVDGTDGTPNGTRTSPLTRLKEISGRQGQSASPATPPLASHTNE